MVLSSTKSQLKTNAYLDAYAKLALKRPAKLFGTVTQPLVAFGKALSTIWSVQLEKGRIQRDFFCNPLHKGVLKSLLDQFYSLIVKSSWPVTR